MKNNLFDKNWFVGLVSLFFAMLLFISVSNENNNYRSMARTNSSASVESSVQLSNVPVVLGNHDEGTYVKGMPETVSVRLTGPRNIINQLTTDNFVVQTESLVGMEPGVRAISLTVNGLPTSVEYKVTPDIFYGNISTRETLEAPITYELASDMIAPGFEVKNVSLDVERVTLTGAKEEIEKVDRVLVYVTSNTPRTGSFSADYKVQILDVLGRPLDISPSIPQVNVTVEISALARTVPIVLIPSGENSHLNYQYQALNELVAIIYGQGSESIQSIKAVVDVTNLTESKTVRAMIEQIEGITIQPQSIDVSVVITESQTSQPTSSSQEEVSLETTQETSAPSTTSGS